MSKVIFFNVPAHGHTNPSLAVVKELVRRGENVIYYSFDDFKEKIEETGAVYRNYGIDVNKFYTIDSSSFTSLYRSLMEINEIIIDKLLDQVKAEKPDYIIHDSICSWGKNIAKILNIPAVSSITVFAFSQKSSQLPIKVLFYILVVGLRNFIKGNKIEKQIMRKYGIKTDGFGDAFMNTEKLNIVYTSKAFQPDGELFDDSFKFIGQSISERNEKTSIEIPDNNTKKIIYISLGTVANNNILFYKQCFEAFGESDLLVVLSVGNSVKIDEHLNDIPKNFIVKNYVPQLEVLSKSAVFVTQAGMNGVHEALAYGVPMVAVPQHPEQAAVAQRISETNTGIYLKTVTPQNLKAAVETVMNTPTYKENAINQGEIMKTSGGFNRAADEIINYKLQFCSL